MSFWSRILILVSLITWLNCQPQILDDFFDDKIHKIKKSRARSYRGKFGNGEFGSGRNRDVFDNRSNRDNPDDENKGGVVDEVLDTVKSWFNNAEDREPNKINSEPDRTGLGDNRIDSSKTNPGVSSVNSPGQSNGKNSRGSYTEVKQIQPKFLVVKKNGENVPGGGRNIIRARAGEMFSLKDFKKFKITKEDNYYTNGTMTVKIPKRNPKLDDLNRINKLK